MDMRTALDIVIGAAESWTESVEDCSGRSDALAAIAFLKAQAQQESTTSTRANRLVDGSTNPIRRYRAANESSIKMEC